jgi:hypothetical protein
MYRRNDPLADCRINSIARDVEITNQQIIRLGRAAGGRVAQCLVFTVKVTRAGSSPSHALRLVGESAGLGVLQLGKYLRFEHPIALQVV